MPSNFVVPPGGFTGFAQMTSASRAALSPMGRAAVRSSRRQGVKIGRRKRKKKASGSGRSRIRATARKPAGRSRKPKFGSPAWHKKYKTGKHRKK